MVKHTQTIRRQQPMTCLSVFDHFVGLALRGLKTKKIDLNFYFDLKIKNDLNYTANNFT